MKLEDFEIREWLLDPEPIHLKMQAYAEFLNIKISVRCSFDEYETVDLLNSEEQIYCSLNLYTDQNVLLQEVDLYSFMVNDFDWLPISIEPFRNTWPGSIDFSVHFISNYSSAVLNYQIDSWSKDEKAT